MLKERPILMSAPMVRAILAGTKTQTRRVACKGTIPPQYVTAVQYELARWRLFDAEHPGSSRAQFTLPPCPHGRPGDRLWVREEHYCFGHWEPVPGMKTKAGRMKWRFVQDTGEVLHAPPQSFRLGRHHKDPATPAWHKRLARFMPRRYSRITLEITEVRVERLQEISESDAYDEGIDTLSEAYLAAEHASIGGAPGPAPAVCAYASLWDNINGPGSWDANPWVWAISFRRTAT